MYIYMYIYNIYNNGTGELIGIGTGCMMDSCRLTAMIMGSITACVLSQWETREWKPLSTDANTALASIHSCIPSQPFDVLVQPMLCTGFRSGSELVVWGMV